MGTVYSFEAMRLGPETEDPRELPLTALGQGLQAAFPAAQYGRVHADQFGESLLAEPSSLARHADVQVHAPIVPRNSLNGGMNVAAHSAPSPSGHR